jgi:hypothetical protein
MLVRQEHKERQRTEAHITPGWGKGGSTLQGSRVPDSVGSGIWKHILLLESGRLHLRAAQMSESSSISKGCEALLSGLGAAFHHLALVLSSKDLK